MPRPPRFTQEEVAVAAFDIVRGGGEESLTARSLAEKLGCSVKPIFGLFDTMDEVLNLQKEGREKRHAAEQELQSIEGALRQKLLEIRK